MSDSLASLRRKIRGVEDLQSVVRTMKAMAAATVGPCEKALAALTDYRRTVELALVASFRQSPHATAVPRRDRRARLGAIVFGTDQGMVGQFNERLAGFVASRMTHDAANPCLWVVGGRLQGRLEDAGFEVEQCFPTPNSVTAITPLIADLLLAIDREHGLTGLDEVLLFHNRPCRRAAYEPVRQRLLPLDEEWRHGIEDTAWPGPARPEVIVAGPQTGDALVREFLFVSLFATCAESLASENSRRFAAMQGAERNIVERLSALTLASNRKRQAAIDEELFDLIAGYEILREASRQASPKPRAGDPAEGRRC